MAVAEDWYEYVHICPLICMIARKKPGSQPDDGDKVRRVPQPVGVGVSEAGGCHAGTTSTPDRRGGRASPRGNADAEVVTPAVRIADDERADLDATQQRSGDDPSEWVVFTRVWLDSGRGKSASAGKLQPDRMSVDERGSTRTAGDRPFNELAQTPG